VEKLRTFAEINRTVQENSIPIGSIISVKFMGVGASGNNTHSARIVWAFIIICVVGTSIKIKAIHSNGLATVKIEMRLDIECGLNL
jgi:hypothetical protein